MRRGSVSGEQRLAGDLGERLWRLVVTESLAEDGSWIEASLSNGSEHLRQQWCDARPPGGEGDCVHVHGSQRQSRALSEVDADAVAVAARRHVSNRFGEQLGMSRCVDKHVEWLVACELGQISNGGRTVRRSRAATFSVSVCID